MDDINSGGQPVFDGVIKSLPPLQISNGEYSYNALVQQCALLLFTNTNFKMDNSSPKLIASECVNKAKILADELGLK